MGQVPHSALGRLRGVFSREESFRGANIEIARRFSKAGWTIGAAIGFSITPFYHPTAVIGDAGWGLTAFDFELIAAWILYLYRFNERVTFNTLLLTAYFGLANVVVAQWLAGGLPAPYHELYPFMIVAAAAVHPPRRFFPFLGVMLAAALLPELDAKPGQLGDLITELLLWIGASVLVVALMWKLRHERAEREELREAAQELARVDQLTELGNRRAFEEALAVEVARASREHAPVSLLMCDLDSFKAINDEHGHLAGDDCLRQVASTLRGELRGADVCFRWGGDEFVVLLAGSGEGEAVEVAERLERVIAATCVRPDGLPLSVTFGHAELIGPMSPAELVATADDALLARKERVSARRAS